MNSKILSNIENNLKRDNAIASMSESLNNNEGNFLSILNKVNLSSNGKNQKSLSQNKSSTNFGIEDKENVNPNICRNKIQVGCKDSGSISKKQVNHTINIMKDINDKYNTEKTKANFSPIHIITDTLIEETEPQQNLNNDYKNNSNINNNIRRRHHSRTSSIISNAVLENMLSKEVKIESRVSNHLDDKEQYSSEDKPFYKHQKRKSSVKDLIKKRNLKLLNIERINKEYDQEYNNENEDIIDNSNNEEVIQDQDSLDKVNHTNNNDSVGYVNNSNNILIEEQNASNNNENSNSINNKNNKEVYSSTNDLNNCVNISDLNIDVPQSPQDKDAYDEFYEKKNYLRKSQSQNQQSFIPLKNGLKYRQPENVTDSYLLALNISQNNNNSNNKDKTGYSHLKKNSYSNDIGENNYNSNSSNNKDDNNMLKVINNIATNYNDNKNLINGELLIHSIIEEETEEFLTDSALSIKRKSIYYSLSNTKKKSLKESREEDFINVINDIESQKTKNKYASIQNSSSKRREIENIIRSGFKGIEGISIIENSFDNSFEYHNKNNTISKTIEFDKITLENNENNYNLLNNNDSKLLTNDRSRISNNKENNDNSNNIFKINRNVSSNKKGVESFIKIEDNFSDKETNNNNNIESKHANVLLKNPSVEFVLSDMINKKSYEENALKKQIENKKKQAMQMFLDCSNNINVVKFSLNNNINNQDSNNNASSKLRETCYENIYSERSNNINNCNSVLSCLLKHNNSSSSNTNRDYIVNSGDINQKITKSNEINNNEINNLDMNQIIQGKEEINYNKNKSINNNINKGLTVFSEDYYDNIKKDYRHARTKTNKSSIFKSEDLRISSSNIINNNNITSNNNKDNNDQKIESKQRLTGLVFENLLLENKISIYISKDLNNKSVVIDEKIKSFNNHKIKVSREVSIDILGPIISDYNNYINNKNSINLNNINNKVIKENDLVINNTYRSKSQMEDGSGVSNMPKIIKVTKNPDLNSNINNLNNTNNANIKSKLELIRESSNKKLSELDDKLKLYKKAIINTNNSIKLDLNKKSFSNFSNIINIKSCNNDANDTNDMKVYVKHRTQSSLSTYNNLITSFSNNNIMNNRIINKTNSNYSYNTNNIRECSSINKKSHNSNININSNNNNNVIGNKYTCNLTSSSIVFNNGKKLSNNFNSVSGNTFSTNSNFKNFNKNIISKYCTTTNPASHNITHNSNNDLHSYSNNDYSSNFNSKVNFNSNNNNNSKKDYTHLTNKNNSTQLNSSNTNSNSNLINNFQKNKSLNFNELGRSTQYLNTNTHLSKNKTNTNTNSYSTNNSLYKHQQYKSLSLENNNKKSINMNKKSQDFCNKTITEKFIKKNKISNNFNNANSLSQNHTTSFISVKKSNEQFNNIISSNNMTDTRFASKIIKDKKENNSISSTSGFVNVINSKTCSSSNYLSHKSNPSISNISNSDTNTNKLGNNQLNNTIINNYHSNSNINNINNNKKIEALRSIPINKNQIKTLKDIKAKTTHNNNNSITSKPLFSLNSNNNSILNNSKILGEENSSKPHMKFNSTAKNFNSMNNIARSNSKKSQGSVNSYNSKQSYNSMKNNNPSILGILNKNFSLKNVSKESPIIVKTYDNNACNSNSTNINTRNQDIIRQATNNCSENILSKFNSNKRGADNNTSNTLFSNLNSTDNNSILVTASFNKSKGNSLSGNNNINHNNESNSISTLSSKNSLNINNNNNNNNLTNNTKTISIKTNSSSSINNKKKSSNFNNTENFQKSSANTEKLISSNNSNNRATGTNIDKSNKNSNAPLYENTYLKAFSVRNLETLRCLRFYYGTSKDKSALIYKKCIDLIQTYGNTHLIFSVSSNFDFYGVYRLCLPMNNEDNSLQKSVFKRVYSISNDMPIMFTENRVKRFFKLNTDPLGLSELNTSTYFDITTIVALELF